MSYLICPNCKEHIDLYATVKADRKGDVKNGSTLPLSPAAPRAAHEPQMTWTEGLYVDQPKEVSHD